MKKSMFKWMGLCAISSMIAMQLSAATPETTDSYTPTSENVASREAFQNDKFGIFIHWGVYSMMGQGEWVMQESRIPRDEYAKQVSGFYPSKFNAHDWVAAIKASGAKYITITSRHHDGFSMFHTKQSNYNIVDATPFKRDVLKELSEECQKQGIALHFYYSHLDWYRDDYYPLGNTGQYAGRDEKQHGEWSSYEAFMKNQLTELLTNYGPIRAIWFDGWWDKPDWNWDLNGQYALIHQLQPNCLVGNNHHKAVKPGEDIQIFERDLPGENKAGYSAGQSVGQLPLETCETMNGMWGYKITDQNYKSTRDLIRYLVSAAGKNANLLMNIGPQPNGELPAVAVQRLKEMGEWMNVYGETIYGTRGGLVSPRDWGVTTQKGNRLFVHITDLKDKGLYLPITQKVKKAFVFKDKTPVKFKQDKQGTVLFFDEVPSDIDYVVELSLE